MEPLHRAAPAELPLDRSGDQNAWGVSLMDVVISVSDLWNATKRARRLILGASVTCALLFFVYFFLKPVSYTAEGTFKGSAPDQSNKLFSALKLFENDENYAASEDPVVFMTSYPVMEEAARSLHLQLHIKEVKRKELLKPIWNRFKAEKAHRVLLGQRPNSYIPTLPVPTAPILTDQECALSCTALNYPGEYSSKLTLTFLDASLFEVRKKGALLGKGMLGTPFVWEGGTFTLNALKTQAGKRYQLSLLPIETVALSLAKAVKVKMCKEHKSLVKVRFTHPDRHLTQAVVNETMEAFQHYLKEEGKQKIAWQLSYLKRRHDEEKRSFERVMEEQKTYLEAHLGEGGMFSLHKEIDILTNKQEKKRHDLSTLSSEIREVHHHLTAEMLTFEEILHHPRLDVALTLQEARAFVQEQEHAIEKLKTERNLPLTSPKIDEIKHKLSDAQNWSGKERALFEEELAKEERFIQKQLKTRQETLFAELQERRHTLLTLLIERYERVEHSLERLTKKAASFPEKWLREQKVELETALHKEMTESITKMIEAKNMGFHLDYLSSAPLVKASLPTIPNSPHLLFGCLVGAFSGAFFLIALLILREMWLGPTPSLSNLTKENLPAIPFSYTLEGYKKVFTALDKSKQVYAIVGSAPTLTYELASLFKTMGENVEVIDLKQPDLAIPDGLLEAYLESTRFQKLLNEKKKQGNHLLIHSPIPLRADQMVYLVKEERISELPTNALYLIEDKPLALMQVVPYLERVVASSHKQSPAPPQTPSSFS